MKCISIYCKRKSYARGLCKKHHKRFMKNKNVNEKTVYELTPEERFLKNVNKNTKTKCWQWIGPTRGTKSYYGTIIYKNNVFSAHRFSWLLFKGKIPKGGDYRGMCVCHKCDNTLCVNPSHLFIGTHTQNMQDKIKKKRCPLKNKKYCKNGHKFSEKNTYITKHGSRSCRKCHKECEKKRIARLRAGG